MAQYSGLTVDKLKAALRSRGATTRGRKVDLIERLESYDRNQNFNNIPEKLPKPVLFDSWPVTGFQQIVEAHRSKLPNITPADLDTYFKYRMAVDNEETGDFKAIEKGQQLLDAKHILACSVHIDKSAYFSGLVSAAMKKKVSYSFRVKVAETGEVINTHCECPAGKGPHGTCKHLAAVLLMLIQFSASGVIVVRRSCTDRLQTFHKPIKTYTGSPKKAESITGGKRRLCNMDDPRPAKYRNRSEYQDHVRNTTINYCATTKKDITIRFLFDRADLGSAVRDHDYLEKPFTQYWVDKSLEITESEAKTLEEKTRSQSKSALWHEERRWRLTASNFGTICKCTSRRNKQKLCQNLVSSRKIVSKSIMHGVSMEPRAIVKLETSCHVQVRKCGMFVSPRYPFLAATPDGVVNDEIIVEVKCPYTGRNEHIEPGKCFPYLCKKNGKVCLKENSSYYFQVQGQLFLSKRKYCLFAVYTYADFFVEKISYDEQYCLGSLLPKLSLFFESFLKPYISNKCML